MDVWNLYPIDYRAREVDKVTQAVRAGECVAVVGLSGAGKSNLLGYLVHRGNPDPAQVVFILVDCNRLKESGLEAFVYLVHRSILSFLGDPPGTLREADEQETLAALLEYWLTKIPRICLVFDRFDLLIGEKNESQRSIIFGNLRALRDRYKYRLTYLTASRLVMNPDSELAELFFAHTIWLGPLSEKDTHWSISQYADRRGTTWDLTITKQIYQLSWGYPSLMRAVCEAYADGCPLEIDSLRRHPAVQRRMQEFWGDHPTCEAVQMSGLFGHPFLTEKPVEGMMNEQIFPDFETGTLTGKEHLLFKYLATHAGEVCEKDEIIRAVWPEDKIYSDGVRDESLAQLVRRLRKKIETDPSRPHRIQTVAGRGYRFILIN